MHLFRKALDYGLNEDIDVMTSEAFCRVAFEHNLGGFGKELFGKVKAK